MTGDPGPYMNDDGDYWVPRTVPYLEARRIARSCAEVDGWCKFVYLGKSDSNLLGFTRDCLCDEDCELSNRCRVCHLAEWECECEEPDLEDWDICLVPAWHFAVVER